MPSDVKDQLQIRLSEHLEATLARSSRGGSGSNLQSGLMRSQAILVLLKELDDCVR